MSPLRMGSSRGSLVSPEQLAAAANSLAAAVEAGGEQLPAAQRRRADAVVAKLVQRRAWRLSGAAGEVRGD